MNGGNVRVDCGDERAKGVKDKIGPTTRGYAQDLWSCFHFGFLRVCNYAPLSSTTVVLVL